MLQELGNSNEYCDMYMFYSEDRLSCYDAEKIMDEKFG